MDLAMVNTTQAMPEPTIERDVRSLLGCLNYINQFISWLMMTCELIKLTL